MGVIVTEHTYQNSFTNDTPDWLIGNVGDWINPQFKCEYQVAFPLSAQNSIKILNGNKLQLQNGKNWEDYGFEVGDIINYSLWLDINYSDSSTTISANHDQFDFNNLTINAINGDTATLSSNINKISVPLPLSGSIDFYFDRLLPNTSNVHCVDNTEIWTDKIPQGLAIEYNFVDNEDISGANLNSIIDGNKTRFEFPDTTAIVATPFSWRNMIPVGYQSGMSIYGASVSYYGAGSNGRHTFQFSIYEMIPTYYDDPQNVKGRILPDMLSGSHSIGDVFQTWGFPKWNNPNLIITQDEVYARQGNVGGFNENYNGKVNDYSISNLQYTDVGTGTVLTSLSHLSKTKVTGTIKDVNNALDSNSVFSLGIVWLPEKEDYKKNKTTAYYQNLIINSGIYQSNWKIVKTFSPTATIDTVVYQGNTNVTNQRIDFTNVRFQMNGSDVDFQFEFDPTTDFGTFISSIDEFDRNYAIYISIGDQLATNESNRVTQLVDVNVFTEFIAPVGAWNPMQIDFLQHTDALLEDITGRCGSDFFIEDDMVARVTFNIDGSGTIPNTMEFDVNVRNLTNGERFSLENYAVNLNSYPVVNGVPQVNFTGSRNFKYKNGFKGNLISIQRDIANDVGNSYAYIAYYGLKIRWEDWLSRPNVPVDFFDSSDLQNGLNNDWYHYLMTAGWAFEFSVYLDAVQNGNDVRYINDKSMMFKNYNYKPNLNSQFIFKDQSGNVLTSPVILNNQKTRLNVIWTKTDGDIDHTVLWGDVQLGVWHGNGEMDRRVIFSDVEIESDNPLRPLPSESYLKISQITSNQVLYECDIDYTLLQNATKFMLSSRIAISPQLVAENSFLIDENADFVIDENTNKILIE